ncbi:MAG: rRNA (guanine966-N2)-methyltransferase [Ilumatobacteraceae bacterium]|jgi:16S rRNA (guanine966-N2)-methyltransferase|nr:rRNA (guanine966-N2)-methyltransferase [Ilumatobacteraceae bacterium]
MIRVVSGEFGGRKLQVPAGVATRPTTDKVRQAVFNSLDSAGLIDGAAIVDLYAGSGALGIEALSRGAATCVFVERDRAALLALRANVAALGLADRTTIVTSDVLAWVPALRGVDLALIDPPYEFEGWAQLLGLLQAPYVVAEAAHEIEAPPGWDRLKSRRYGRTWVTQLERVA